MQKFSEVIAQILRQHKRHSEWMRLVSALMVLTLFCTTAVLIRPALSMDEDVYCGLEEHTHTADCCDAQGELICGLEEHTHADECYIKSAGVFNPGTSVIQGAQASAVWFGETNGSPVKWRVLAASGGNGSASFADDEGTVVDAANAMFLMTDTLQASSIQFDLNGTSGSNTYQGSNAQAWCADFAGSAFKPLELAAILQTTKSDGAYTSSTYSSALSKTVDVTFNGQENILNGDKVFFLSAEEAASSAFGFTADTKTTEETRILTCDGEAYTWWLRSQHSDDDEHASGVYTDGCIVDTGLQFAWAAEPALNLNTEKVLFTTAADNSAQADFTAITNASADEWKLTLADGNDFAANASAEGAEDGTLSLTAETASTVTVNHSALSSFEYAGYTNVTAVLLNEDGEALYYGSVNSDTSATSSTVTLPALEAGTYRLKLYAEDWNDAYVTNYASGTPFEVTLTVTEADEAGGSYRFTQEDTALGLQFTAALTDSSALPASLTGSITELDGTAENYSAMQSAAADAAGAEDEDVHLYRLGWADGDNEYSPADTAQISLSVAGTDGSSETAVSACALFYTGARSGSYTAVEAGETDGGVLSMNLTGADGFAVVCADETDDGDTDNGDTNDDTNDDTNGTVTGTRDITVTKNWEDDVETHDDVTVSLYRGITRTAAITITANGATEEMTATAFMALVEEYNANPENYAEGTQQYIAYTLYEQYFGSTNGWTSGISDGTLTGTQYEDTEQDFTLDAGGENTVSATLSDLPTGATSSNSMSGSDGSTYTITITITNTYDYYVAEDNVPVGYFVSYRDPTFEEINDGHHHYSSDLTVVKLETLDVDAVKVPTAGKVDVDNDKDELRDYITISLQKEWDAADEQTLDTVYVDVYQVSYAEIIFTTDEEGTEEVEKTEDFLEKLKKDYPSTVNERGVKEPVVEAKKLDAISGNLDEGNDPVDSYVLNGTDKTEVGSYYRKSRNYIKVVELEGVTYYVWSKGVCRYFVAEAYSDYAQEDYEVTYEQEGVELARYQVDADDGEKLFASVWEEVADGSGGTYETYLPVETEYLYGYGENKGDLTNELKALLENGGSLTAVGADDTTADISTDYLKLAEITGDGTVTIKNTAPTEDVTVTKEWDDSASEHADVTASLYRKTTRTAQILKQDSNTLEVSVMSKDDFVKLVQAYKNDPTEFELYYECFDNTTGETFYQKRDDDGHPVYDDDGNPCFVDEDGNDYTPNYDDEIDIYECYPAEYLANYMYEKYFGSSGGWTTEGDGLIATLVKDTGQDFTLSESSNLTETLSKLPKGTCSWDLGADFAPDDNGEAYYYWDDKYNLYAIEITDTYQYYVAEDAVPDGYTVNYSGTTETLTIDGEEITVAVPKNGSVTITNTGGTPATPDASISVEKVWADEAETHNDVTIALYRSVYRNVTFERADGTVMTWDDVQAALTEEDGNGTVTSMCQTWLSLNDATVGYDPLTYGESSWFTDEPVTTLTLKDGALTNTFADQPQTGTLTDNQYTGYTVHVDVAYTYYVVELDGVSATYTTSYEPAAGYTLTRSQDETGLGRKQLITEGTPSADEETSATVFSAVKVTPDADGTASITVTNTAPENIDITVKKEWDDQAEETSHSGDEATVSLYRRSYRTARYYYSVYDENGSGTSTLLTKKKYDELIAEYNANLANNSDYYDAEKNPFNCQSSAYWVATVLRDIYLVDEDGNVMDYGDNVAYKDEQIGSITLTENGGWTGTFEGLPLAGAATKDTGTYDTIFGGLYLDYDTDHFIQNVDYFIVQDSYEYYIKEESSAALSDYEPSYAYRTTTTSGGETDVPLALHHLETTETGSGSGTTTTVKIEPGESEDNCWDNIVNVTDTRSAIITNRKKEAYTLPETGGTGVLPYYAFGGALALGAAVLLLLRRRRRRREEG